MPTSVIEHETLVDRCRRHYGLGNRAEKAAYYAIGNWVKEDEEASTWSRDQWKVKSQSTLGWHTVSLTDGFCSCTFAQMNSQTGGYMGLCSHQMAVIFRATAEALQGEMPDVPTELAEAFVEAADWWGVLDLFVQTVRRSFDSSIGTNIMTGFRYKEDAFTRQVPRIRLSAQIGDYTPLDLFTVPWPSLLPSPEFRRVQIERINESESVWRYTPWNKPGPRIGVTPWSPTIY